MFLKLRSTRGVSWSRWRKVFSHEHLGFIIFSCSSPAISCPLPVKVCKDTVGRHFPKETQWNPKSGVIQAPEKVTPASSPTSTDACGARVETGEAAGGELQVAGPPSRLGGWGCSVPPGLTSLRVYALPHLGTVRARSALGAALSFGRSQATRTAHPLSAVTVQLQRRAVPLKGQWLSGSQDWPVPDVPGTRRSLRSSIRGTGRLGRRPAHTRP